MYNFLHPNFRWVFLCASKNFYLYSDWYHILWLWKSRILLYRQNICQILRPRDNTLPAEMFEGSDFWMETMVIIKISTYAWYLRSFWLIFMEIKQKKNFFWKTKFKMADSKKVRFSKSPILKMFLWKFHRLVLGLVELIDAKGINLVQHIWSWGCPT